MTELAPKRPVRFIISLVIFLVLAGVTGYISQNKRLYPHPSYVYGTLHATTLKLQIADTPNTRAMGLSGVQKLGDNEGMLFVFSSPSKDCFWMNDMKFSIDILWFDENQKLFYQQQNITPNTYPNSFCPPRPARYVVEVNVGVSRQLGLQTGDMLNLDKQ